MVWFVCVCEVKVKYLYLLFRSLHINEQNTVFIYYHLLLINFIPRTKTATHKKKNPYFDSNIPQ